MGTKIMQYVLRTSLVCFIVSFGVMLPKLRSLSNGAINEVVANSAAMIVLVLAIGVNAYLLVHHDRL